MSARERTRRPVVFSPRLCHDPLKPNTTIVSLHSSLYTILNRDALMEETTRCNVFRVLYLAGGENKKMIYVYEVRHYCGRMIILLQQRQHLVSTVKPRDTTSR